MSAVPAKRKRVQYSHDEQASKARIHISRERVAMLRRRTLCFYLNDVLTWLYAVLDYGARRRSELSRLSPRRPTRACSGPLPRWLTHAVPSFAAFGISSRRFPIQQLAEQGCRHPSITTALSAVGVHRPPMDSR